MTANQIAYQRQREDARANLVKEEQARHQLAHEKDVLAETRRANLARETENQRHNAASEDFQVSQLLKNAELGYANLSESQRSNLARELENTRHNLASEAGQIYTADQRYAGAEISARTNQTVTTQKLAAEKALQKLKEDREDRRTKARLEVEKAKTTSGLLNNLADSIVRLLPGVR